MKLHKVVLLIIALIVVLTGCGTRGLTGARIDYGTSECYTKEDMDEAIRLIEAEFATWEGCQLHRITYGSDEECGEENVAWMNALEAANDAKEHFTECIMFKSDFRSPKAGGGAWIANYEYTDWQWWLARAKGGEWKLMTWGY